VSALLDTDARDDAREELEALQDAEAAREIHLMILDLTTRAAALQRGVPKPGDLGRLLRMNLQLAALQHALTKFD